MVRQKRPRSDRILARIWSISGPDPPGFWSRSDRILARIWSISGQDPPGFWSRSDRGLVWIRKIVFSICLYQTGLYINVMIKIIPSPNCKVCRLFAVLSLSLSLWVWNRELLLYTVLSVSELPFLVRSSSLVNLLQVRQPFWASCLLCWQQFWEFLKGLSPITVKLLKGLFHEIF